MFPFSTRGRVQFCVICPPGTHHGPHHSSVAVLPDTPHAKADGLSAGNAAKGAAVAPAEYIAPVAPAAGTADASSSPPVSSGVIESKRAAADAGAGVGRIGVAETAAAVPSAVSGGVEESKVDPGARLAPAPAVSAAAVVPAGAVPESNAREGDHDGDDTDDFDSDGDDDEFKQHPRNGDGLDEDEDEDDSASVCQGDVIVPPPPSASAAHGNSL